MTEILSLPSSLRLVLFIAEMLTSATILFCAVYGIIGKHDRLRVSYACSLFATLVVLIVTHTPLLENMNETAALCFHLVLVAPFVLSIFIVVKEKDFTYLLDAVWCIASIPFLNAVPYYSFVSSALFAIVIVRTALIVKTTLDSISEHPGRLAIKYALDRTVDGIAFVNIFGRITYLNTVLKWVLADMEISSYMRASKIIEEIKSFAATGGRKVTDLSYIVNTGSKSYRFNFDAPLTQITCVDVTEEERLVKKSEQNKALLEKTNEELSKALGEIESIEKERELLKIKGQLHDELAQHLSILHMFILNDTSGDLKNLKSMLSSLEITPQNDAIEGSVSDLAASLKSIGIKLEITGNLPNNEDIKKIAYKLTKEATTNAIKHGKAREILVDFKVENNTFVATATNHGIMPKSIRFGNGLSTLKAEIASQNGELDVSFDDVFSLVAKIPLG